MRLLLLLLLLLLLSSSSSSSLLVLLLLLFRRRRRRKGEGGRREKEQKEDLFNHDRSSSLNGNVEFKETIGQGEIVMMLTGTVEKEVVGNGGRGR